jgi:hypothetical protein
LDGRSQAGTSAVAPGRIATRARTA